MVHDLIVQLNDYYDNICQNIASEDFAAAGEQLVKLQQQLETIFNHHSQQLTAEHIRQLTELNEKIPVLLLDLVEQGKDIEQELVQISRRRGRLIAKTYHI